jgi:hypothetical protein
MTQAREPSQHHRELSVKELDSVAGGATAVTKPSSLPKQYLTLNLENTMISG